ncbi:MAG: hypothetical protein NZM27_07415, partial [Acetobacteraceae bacterium]|nr:hypothetical protein [Acetobacteraceae bacterium]
MIARTGIRHLRIRFDRPVGGSGVAMVDVIAATLTDADGAEGLGFSYVIGGGGEAAAAIAASLAERFLAGRPVPAPRIAWRRMAASFNRSGPGPNLVALAALDVARRVGQDPLANRLRALGLRGVGAGERHGGALVLGGVGVRALELADAYTTLARFGTRVPLSLALVGGAVAGERVMHSAH